MPTAGKSYVGKQLAQLMHKTFIDTDQKIMEAIGETLASYIAKNGNEQFLHLEAQTILSIGDDIRNTVISTGGSVVYNPKAMEFLCKISVVIHQSK